MVREKTTRTIALALSAWTLLQPFIFQPDGIGLQADPTITQRLTYQFFHTGIIHSMLNAWAMLTITFRFQISPRQLITAYAVSVTIPTFCLSPTPTIGLSGIVYALLGLLSFRIPRKWQWQGYIWTGILLGLLIPNVAVSLHSYCFAIGTLIALINHPIIRQQ